MKKILVVASMMMLWISGAWALGTTAGTVIENNATLSYSAGGVLQPDVNTTTADSFVVDRKIDMVLVTTNTDQLDVTPGQTERITKYAFQNEGNADQNFSFSVGNLSSGGQADYNTDADDENVSNFIISCDGGTPTPAISPIDGNITVLVGIDDNLSCTVSVSIPFAPTGADGDIMNIRLTATAVNAAGAAETETPGADTPSGTPDIVFADGETDATLGSNNASKGDVAGDGQEVANSGYIIATPVLSVVKTSCVISDPVNNTSSNRRRIPGAVIRYMLDITNTGTAGVTDLNITDALDVANLDYTTVDTPPNNAHVDIGAGPCSCAAPGAGTSTVSNSGSSPIVELNGIDVAAPISPQTENRSCVYFQVNIL